MPPRKASSSSSKPRTAKTTTAIASTAPPSQSDMPSTEAHLGLIIECLTFNPRIYIDGLTHLATEGVYERGLELEKSILAILKEKGVADAEHEAERGTHKMKTLIDNCLDHVFDTLELYSYKQVFGITTRQASNMVLPHHAGLDLRRGEGDDHERESRELEERQRELTRKLNAAKSTSHALNLALEASTRQMNRARSVHSKLAYLLGDYASEETGGIQATVQHLVDAIQIIRSQRSPLLINLEELRAVDPLGKALIHSTSSLASGSEPEDKAGIAGAGAGAGAGAEEVEPWSAGREGYLRWQTQRMLSSSRRSMGGAAAGYEGGDTTLGGSGGDTSMLASGKGRKRKSGMGTGADESMTSAARRGRPSVALHSTDDGMEGEEVGKTGEMERLANLMSHRPTSAAKGSGDLKRS
ncbi:hypothetical protein BCV69DRAFT_280654 [Microstroma glucosiphilum]|uniref:Mis12-domain-containing protein n=1 Tax=Pseudomicrostroma glucosiphilum TaxID=1684307 RepID=A0A316UCW0_9BASI|nr:hypothetical protein BCV69DRAFT_280654 [Pseudomicrostroma glucosiphilum]PWN23036.1 hypothetical protein BCV69DRAFT_280654 [Pseudomicrostroma glucosiphilum]